MLLLRLAVLLLFLAANAALAATQVEPQDDAHDRRRHAQIAQIARSVFPLRVLALHWTMTPGRAELYTVQLDAREVANAPQPILTTQILIVPGATVAMIELAMRAAAENVRELVARAEGRKPPDRILMFRPDLVQ